MNDPLPDPALDRPELLPGSGGLQQLRNLACFGGVSYLIAQAVWPAVAPPATVAGTVALWGVAAAIVWGFVDPRMGFSTSGSFELLGIHRSFHSLRIMWWRALLMLAWVPGWLWLLIDRARALSDGAAPAVGWGAAGECMAIAMPLLLVATVLTDRHPTFLHAAGIQSGKMYFHAWERIAAAHASGPDLLLEIGCRSPYPTGHAVVRDPAARARLVGILRGRGIPVDEALPAMLLGKASALAVTAVLTALAPVLSGTGIPWGWSAASLIAAALGAKLVEERFTGISRLRKNPLRPRPPGRLDEIAFTTRWSEALRARSPGTEVESVGTLQLRSRRDRSAEWMQHHLANAWRMYTADPAQLDRIIIDYVGGSCEAQALGDVAIERIVPALRSTATLAALREQGSDPVARELAGDLVAILVEDHPQTIRYLAQGDLAPLGLDAPAAWRWAEGNLARLVTERTVSGRDGLYLIEAPCHAGALLLDRSWRTAQRFPVEGRPVVGMLGRDAAFITGSGEAAALALIPSLLARARETGDPHASSTCALIREDGTWEEFVLPGSVPPSRGAAGG